jgi:fumarate reductase flavoprotein subunit
LLEQGRDEGYPCNSRYSGGIIHVAYHNLSRPPAELLDLIRTSTEDTASLPLATAIAEGAEPLVSWLQGLGVRFMRFSQVEFHRWCMAPPRPVTPGLDWKGRGPDVSLRLLAARLKELGGDVALGTRVKALRMSQGRCIGVVAETEDGEADWSAANVVIADGGFQANAALFRNYVASGFEQVFQRGAGTGRGDGLTMAMAVGAAVVPSPYFYGHILSLDAFNNNLLWPYPELDAIACSGLVIGKDGRRIVDEGLGGIAVANSLARLPDPASCVAIFDAAIWDGPGKTARIPANPLLERAGGKVFRADTVEELATMLGVPSDALVETVRAHNAAIASGTMQNLSPPRSDRHKAWHLENRPFMAIRLCPGMTHTMGGIAINESAQVLDTKGDTIPGLFAAGTTTGGLEGGNRTGYVGGLVQAGVFGMRAAEKIASLRAS